MQDYRVKTFLTVCRTLNYTRAAEELALTQPAVSQHITYLEREYGAKLFTYHRKKLELTPAGRVLRDGLATMAHDDVLLHERIEEVAHGATVKLRIGMTLTARRVRGGPAPRPLSGRPTRHSGHRALGRNPAPDGAPRRGNHRLRLRGRALRQGPLCLTPLLVRAFGAHLRGRASLPAYATHPGRPLGRTAHSARGGQRQPQRACPRLAQRNLSPPPSPTISSWKASISSRYSSRPILGFPSFTRPPCSGRCKRARCALSPSPMRASSTTSASFTCATASTSRIWKIFSKRSKHSLHPTP